MTITAKEMATLLELTVNFVYAEGLCPHTIAEIAGVSARQAETALAVINHLADRSEFRDAFSASYWEKAIERLVADRRQITDGTPGKYRLSFRTAKLWAANTAARLWWLIETGEVQEGGEQFSAFMVNANAELKSACPTAPSFVIFDIDTTSKNLTLISRVEPEPYKIEVRYGREPKTSWRD